MIHLFLYKGGLFSLSIILCKRAYYTYAYQMCNEVQLVPHYTDAAFASLCDHLHVPIASTLTRLLCALCYNGKTYHEVHKQNKYPHASFVCTLHFITFSNRFYRCLDHFQSITNTLELNYFVFETLFIGIRESCSRALWFLYLTICFFSSFFLLL